MKYTIIERLTKIGKRLLDGADKSEVKADWNKIAPEIPDSERKDDVAKAFRSRTRSAEDAGNMTMWLVVWLEGWEAAGGKLDDSPPSEVDLTLMDIHRDPEGALKRALEEMGCKMRAKDIRPAARRMAAAAEKATARGHATLVVPIEADGVDLQLYVPGHRDSFYIGDVSERPRDARD